MRPLGTMFLTRSVLLSCSASLGCSALAASSNVSTLTHTVPHLLLTWKSENGAVVPLSWHIHFSSVYQGVPRFLFS